MLEAEIVSENELMSKILLHVENLVKSFGSIKAVNGLSFEVKSGEVFGLPIVAPTR